MVYGYNGKILRVNLTEGKITEDYPDEYVYRKYMGGSALALYYLLKEQVPHSDPLGPDNKFVLMSSVVQGISVPGFVRFTAAARSPLTGGFAEGEAGGFWGPELKAAGFDGIIIEGQSPEPVYLWINNGTAELRSAHNLWGKDTGDVERIIREEHGDKRVRVLQCGPGGERMVRYACLTNELKHAIGRAGLGAVMGSKRLRAVAVRGTQKLPLADENRIREITKQVIEKLPDYPIVQNYKKLGTASLIMPNQEAGMLPTRNWQAGHFEGAERISGQTLNDELLYGTKGCYKCPIRCKRVVKSDGEYTVSPEYGGPEYETIAGFGSLCGIDNLEAIAYANELCNRWGLDTISTSVSIAFAMECREKGLVTRDDTDGIDLVFGNTEAMLQMVEKISLREGFGEVLSQGVKRASEIIGGGSESFAMHVKGQEMPLHEVRGKHGVALGFAVSPTGADHLEAPHDTALAARNIVLDQAKPIGILDPLVPQDLGPQKIRYFTHGEQMYGFFNALGLCNFAAAPYSPLALPMIAEVIQATTGWNTSLFELMELGERDTTMARVFNIREGWTKDDDTLPRRLFEILEGDSAAEKKILENELKEAIKLYYESMGWDSETGIPTDGRLTYLDLDWLIQDKPVKKKA